MIKRLIPNNFKRKIIDFKKQIRGFEILAKEYGQYNTIKNWECIDRNGDKIAWYTYPAIEYLRNIDFSEKSIFEYGSGNSSIFWSNIAKDVISIEHDETWFNKIKTDIKVNQKLLLKENNVMYEDSIKEINKKFDLIIIDGIRRPECSKVIAEYLNKESNEGFMVILDNSDWYKETSKYLKNELNLIEVDFHGFGPINDYTWTTSIFLSRNFNFKAIDDTQPHYSVAASCETGE